MNRWLWGDIWESLTGRPGRTLLALLAVSVGTLALTVLISTIIGLSVKARAITEEFGADVLAVLPGKAGRGSSGLEREHLEILRGSLPDHRMTGIRHYTVRSPEWKGALNVLAGDEELIRVRPWTLESGRPLDPMDIAEGRRYAMISVGLSKARSLSLGDYLRIYPCHFEIVGIIHAAGAALKEARPDLGAGSEFAVIPYSVRPVWELTNRPTGRQLDVLYVKYPADSDATTAISRIGNLLAPSEQQIGPITYVSEETLISGIRRLRRTIELTTGSIAVLCLLLGGTTLMSLMIAEVRERVSEIGLRLALGGSEFDIYSLFVLEALVTTGIASLIGSGSAYVLLVVIRRWITFPTHFGPVVFLFPIAVALGLGMLFSFWPARHAARITPSEALRNE